MNYVLSQEAELDLVDIYDYSLEEWGTAQADIYLRGLYDAFATSSRFPAKGRLRLDLGFDVRSVLYKSHIIFYVEAVAGIAIVRVMHHARDIDEEFSR